MCMCAHVCVHAIACVWRSGEPVLSSHLWAPGMEFRSSVLVVGTFTHWTVSPTQSAILELEGRLEWESTWLCCKAVYGVTHGKAGNKHYSTLPLSDSKPVWAHCPKFNGIFQPMRCLKSLGGNLPGRGVFPEQVIQTTVFLKRKCHCLFTILALPSACGMSADLPQEAWMAGTPSPPFIKTSPLHCIIYNAPAPTIQDTRLSWFPVLILKQSL